MPEPVRDEGTGRERIALVGEAPGKLEQATGRPFVGAAGALQTRWLHSVGLQHSDVYWTNTYPTLPDTPGHKLALVPKDERAAWVEDLHTRLAALDDPWVLVPVGDFALQALTGKKGIVKHRGSVYEYVDLRGRHIKVIGTIHPAATFRRPVWEGRCRADWQRIKGDLAFRELRLPQREHVIKPTLDDCEAFLEDARQRAKVLIIDVETPRKRLVEVVQTKRGTSRVRHRKGSARVTCVGFSFDPALSLTIPTTPEYWGEDLPAAWAIIRRLCALETCEKGGQNLHFDAFWLLDHDVPITRWCWDTRWLHHAQHPMDEHGLAYQASLFTREPYWKDDTKEANELESEWIDWEVFLRYNGKDCTTTLEVLDHHLRVMTDAQRRLYDALYQSLFAPMLDLMRHGLRVDTWARRRRANRLIAERLQLQDALATLAGEPLHGKTDLSNKKLQRFLYETLRLPLRKERKTGAATTKEVAVRQLMLKHPKALGTDQEPDKPGSLILRYRRVSKLLGSLKETTEDADGRTRDQLGFTYTLRFTSGKSPRRTGQNKQNIDHELLDLYVPDEGCICMELDLSQGEDRIVKVLTKSPRLIERARLAPWENDEHRRAASVIFRIPETAITASQRFIGKRSRHASNYGLHGQTLSEELLKDGYVYTPDECERFVETIIHKDTPEVLDWQRAVRATVMRDRAITTTWGYTVSFQYFRLDDDLYRKAYATQPQSELTTILKQWGLLPLWQYLRDTGLPARLNNEEHDSLLLSTPPKYAWLLAQFLKRSLERPRVYGGVELTIPVEVKLGRTAACEVEYKRWPDRRTFEAQAYALLDERTKEKVR